MSCDLRLKRLAIESLESRYLLTVLFTKSEFELVTSRNTETDVRLGDLDGDGDLDAVVPAPGNELEWPGTVYFNNGQGRFEAQQEIMGWNVQLGDLDGDGDLDAVTSTGEPGTFVWLNDGQGRLIDSGQRLGPQESGVAVLMQDFDGDGDLDAMIGLRHSASTLWLNSDGKGNFVLGGRLGTAQSGARLAAADLDGDGDVDVYQANRSGLSTIWLNTGLGVFVKGQTMDDGDDTLRVALGDLDGDGDADAYLANGANDPVPNQVWLNDGQAFFSDSGQRLGDAATRDVALADLDADGDLDAFVGNGAGTDGQLPDHVYINDGTGRFHDTGIRIGNAVSHLAVGDLDGDDDFDVFMADRHGADTIWFGEVSDSIQGDANHDGRVDFNDFLRLSAEFGKSGAVWEDGDFNADGSVDFADFIVLAANFTTDQP